MRAIVLGVSGLTGRAIAAEFANAGWDVLGTGRDVSRFPPPLREHGVEFARSDRYDGAELAKVLARGADVVVDCLCYRAEHARQLLRCSASFASVVMLSSKAVYVDGQGRHSNSAQPPHFDGPVTEQQSVLAPDYSGAFDSGEGYGANKVTTELALLESDELVSILRPSRIHGPGTAQPREWFVVRRLLDGRRRIPLAHQGLTGNHPTAAANLARLVRVCSEQPGRRLLNAADPDAPTARAIVDAIAAACARSVEVVGLADNAPPEHGWSPWANWPPYFLDTTAAAALGYEPVSTYAYTVGAAVDELRSLSPEHRAHIERHQYFTNRFDYRLDDVALTQVLP